MTQFYFVLTNIEAEVILKEEIRLRYPELRLSYSRPGFITFKSENEIDFHPLFCRLSGRSLGKFKKHELKLEKFWVYALSDQIEVPPDLKFISDRTIFKIGELVKLLVMDGPDNFWLCEYVLETHHFQTPGEVSSVAENKVAPSRAYYKIAEVTEALDLGFNDSEVALELGSSPGGASLFLLENGLKVLGVDPADMDPLITKNIHFKHLRCSFETLSERDFTTKVNWIICDINLPPTVVLKEIVRLLSLLHPRGLIVTFKMNDLKHLQIMANVRKTIRNLGFSQVELKYLPSHRKEINLVALRS